jgi:hypothetical protein
VPRIGVEAPGDPWDTHDIQINFAFADGRVFSAYGAHPTHDPRGADGKPRTLGAGPLSLEMIEPYGHLKIRVDGVASSTTIDEQMKGFIPGLSPGGDEVAIQAEIDLRPVVPPWLNGSTSEEAHRVLSTQEEGWLIGYPWRFEQLCRATGTITVDGVTRQLDGGADRIRRQSIRRLASFWGHSWQAGLFSDGRAFGYQTYPARKDGKVTYNEGYVFLGDGALVPARVTKVPWLHDLQPSGENVSLVLETADEAYEIEGETAMSTFMIMPPEVGGGMQLQQAVTRYTWDGVSGMGMTERSNTPDAMTP